MAKRILYAVARVFKPEWGGQNGRFFRNFYYSNGEKLNLRTSPFLRGIPQNPLAKASALTGEEILAGCPEMLRGSGLVQVTGKEGRAQVVLELPP